MNARHERRVTAGEKENDNKNEVGETITGASTGDRLASHNKTTSYAAQYDKSVLGSTISPLGRKNLAASTIYLARSTIFKPIEL